MTTPPAHLAGIAQADCWPRLPLAQKVSDAEGRLVAWGTVPHMDNTGRDYLFEVSILATDPNDGRALAHLASVAISEFPRFLGAMVTAHKALTKGRRVLADGDAQNAIRELEQAISAGADANAEDLLFDGGGQGPAPGVPYSYVIGAYLRNQACSDGDSKGRPVLSDKLKAMLDLARQADPDWTWRSVAAALRKIYGGSLSLQHVMHHVITAYQEALSENRFELGEAQSQMEQFILAPINGPYTPHYPGPASVVATMSIEQMYNALVKHVLGNLRCARTDWLAGA